MPVAPPVTVRYLPAAKIVLPLRLVVPVVVPNVPEPKNEMLGLVVVLPTVKLVPVVPLRIPTVELDWTEIAPARVLPMVTAPVEVPVFMLVAKLEESFMLMMPPDRVEAAPVTVRPSWPVRSWVARSRCECWVTP